MHYVISIDFESGWQRPYCVFTGRHWYDLYMTTGDLDRVDEELNSTFHAHWLANSFVQIQHHLTCYEQHAYRAAMVPNKRFKKQRMAPWTADEDEKICGNLGTCVAVHGAEHNFSFTPDYEVLLLQHSVTCVRTGRL